MVKLSVKQHLLSRNTSDNDQAFLHVVFVQEDRDLTTIKQTTEAIVLDLDSHIFQQNDTYLMQMYNILQSEYPFVPIIFYSSYEQLQKILCNDHNMHPFAYVLKDNQYKQLFDTLRSARFYLHNLQQNLRLLQTLQQAKEQKRLLEEELQKKDLLIATDSLTDIYNRRFFFQAYHRQLQQALRHQRFISLLMIDIDHFKMLNDNYGHVFGDMVLREIARMLRDNIRNIDILGRVGGDEFAIVLPETNLEGAKQCAKRLCAIVEEHTFSNRFNTMPAHVTVSIGGCTFVEGPMEDSESFFHTADAMLYTSKEQGRNSIACCVYQHNTMA